MQIKKLKPMLGFIFCLTLFSTQARAACGDGMANVTNACQTEPSGNTYNQSSMDQKGENDSIYAMSMDLARTLESAANDNRSTAASCRAAGSTCAAECTAEAAAERAKIQPCGDDDDEDSSSCEEKNAACEAEAQRLEAIGALCSSTSDASASTFDSQASIFDSQAAQARKTAAAAKAAQGKTAGQPPKSLSSGGGGGSHGDQKHDPNVYSDQQCLSASDAFKHVSCTDRYVKQCRDRLADPRCQKFAKHYCEPPPPGSEEVAAVDASTPESGEEEEKEDNYRQGSEGVGTAFCQFAVSTQFCAAGNRDHCPSCSYLHQFKSCSQKSEVCLPNLSDEEKVQAQAACPLDPLFLNADFRPPMPEAEEEELFVGDGTMLAVEKVTSEIYPASSPSLFHSQSRAIQKRCEQDMLNCGK